MSSTAACSVATVMILRRLEPAALSTVPFSAQLMASVALPVKASAAALEPKRLLDLLASNFDRGVGLASPARRRMGVGEPVFGPWPHRVRDFGRDRRRRLIIEIDHAASALPRSANPPPLAKETIDIRHAGRRAEADPDHTAGDLRIDSHRGEHPARLHAPRRTGASRRNGDSREVELHQLAGAGNAGQGIGADGRRSAALSAAMTMPPARDDLFLKPARSSARRGIASAKAPLCERRRHAGRGRHILRPAPIAPLLPAARLRASPGP